LNAYRRDGFILRETGLEAHEVAYLRGEVEALLEKPSPDVAFEPDGVTVRALHGCHHRNEAFARLVVDPRLLGPAQAILGESVYVHQLKINTKAARCGERWVWHQDFVFWEQNDSIREARLVTALVMLDGSDSMNGALEYAPGSHVLGMLWAPDRASEVGGERWRSDVGVDLSYALEREQVEPIVDRFGSRLAVGWSGAIGFFHPNLVHCSAANRSEQTRFVAYVTYNAVSNRPARPSERPEFLCATDTRPLAAGPVGALAPGSAWQHA